MAFPTSSLTNNLVHKEGNRAFVYDSALGVWDQVRETDRTATTLYVTQEGEIGGNTTIGSGVTFPAGHIVQVVNNTFTTNSNSSSFGTSIDKVQLSLKTPYRGRINNVGASNHVYIQATFQLRLESSSTNPGAEVVFTRETTNLWSGTTYDFYNYGYNSGSGTDKVITLSWMDESPATGTNNYWTSGRKHDGNTTAYIKGGGFPFKMVLMEIQR